MLEFLKELAPYVNEFIAGAALPFIVAYLSKLNWKAEYKFAVSILVSIVAAVISAFAENKFDGISLAGSVIVVFTTAQIIYNGAFKALGLERVMFPEMAVVDKATNLVKEELRELTREQAQRILDSRYADSISVYIDRNERTP